MKNVQLGIIIETKLIADKNEIAKTSQYFYE